MASDVWIVAVLIAIGAALRFGTIASQSYWLDEATTVHEMHLSFGAMLHQVHVNETTPPLYFIVAWLWAKVFGTSEAGLRSLSALLTARRFSWPSPSPSTAPLLDWPTTSAWPPAWAGPGAALSSVGTTPDGPRASSRHGWGYGSHRATPWGGWGRAWMSCGRRPMPTSVHDWKGLPWPG
jgi:hypothetical protein